MVWAVARDWAPSSGPGSLQSCKRLIHPNLNIALNVTDQQLVGPVSFAGLGAGSPCVGTCVCVLAPLSLSLRQNMPTKLSGKWFCLGHTGRSPQPRINPVLVQVVPLEVVARGLRKVA